MGVKVDCSNSQETAFSPTIAQRKALMREAVRIQALGVYTGGITAGGATFASDADARRDLQEAFIAALAAQVDSEAFTADIELLNGNVTNLTRAQVVGLAKAFRTHTAAVRANARALIISINGASTHGQLDAIDLGAGWPT